jgi:CubicO group peptidase (beta-lactamase class C family)
MNTRNPILQSCVRILAVCFAVSWPFLLRNASGYEYAVPEATNDGWAVAPLGSEGCDAEIIKALFEGVLDGTYKNIRSVLIARNGKLVVEEYFPREEGNRRAQAFQRVAPQEITSATKSITSILIGIAIDQKLIQRVDEPVSALLPEYAALLTGGKQELRLRDLLTMCAGLSWDEWTFPYSDARNDHIRMLQSTDPIRFVFEQPLVAKPGTKFAYSSGVSIALGEILHRAAKMPVDKFAEKHLFAPLGISDFYWSKYPGEIVQTGGGLFLRPRDMAKVGLLFLDGGRFQGKRVVSEHWVQQSTTNHAPAGQIPEAARAEGYGYQWWLSSLRIGEKTVATFSARGRGGQFIIVLPSKQLVALFTSHPDNSAMFQPLEIMERFVLPAVEKMPSAR